MENTEPKRNNIGELHQQAHEEAKIVLGSLYSEATFDQAMGSFLHDDQGFNESFQKLKSEVEAAASEEEKNMVRQTWLDENNLFG